MQKKGENSRHISKETIEKARKIDLLSYLMATNPSEIVKCGSGEYCTRAHDSLKISNGKWFWWSRGIGGTSALDYLVKVRGIDFISAIDMVMGEAVEIPSVFVPVRPRKYSKIYLPKYNYECKFAKKYLVERGIDEAIIDDCIRKKLIAEDSKNGCVLFMGYDESGVIKHCSSRATDGTLQRKDLPGSDKRYAFSLASNKENSTVRVFESAIDLLSFASMIKAVGKDYRAENLISLSGIYLPKKEMCESKIPLALKYFLDNNAQIKRICLYFDNDFAGRRGAEALQNILGGMYEVRYIPPHVGKDYNDYLIKRMNDERTKDSEKIQSENQRNA
jgi:hypothetical protein